MLQSDPGHLGEAGRVVAWGRGLKNDPIVTRHLALETKAPADPPDRRVPPEQCLYGRLSEHGPVVAALNMAILVEDDTIEVGVRECSHETLGQRDDGRPKAEHTTGRHILGHAQLCRTALVPD